MLVSVGESGNKISSPGVICTSLKGKNLSENFPQNNKKECEKVLKSNQKFLFEWSDLVFLRITTILLVLLVVKGIIHPKFKFCHHLPTLILFLTCDLVFFFFINGITMADFSFLGELVC